MVKQKTKRKKKTARFTKIRQKFRLILTRRKGKIYVKSSPGERTKQIKPATVKEKKQVKKIVGGMKKEGIDKIDMQAETAIKVEGAMSKKSKKGKG